VTRAAGLALTKALSKEYAPHNILVNTVSIGLIRAGQHEKKAEKAGVPLEKLYADMGLQVIYAALSVYGWYEWLYGGQGIVLGSLRPVQVEHEAKAMALAFLQKQNQGDTVAARSKYDEFVASRLLTYSEVDALLKARSPIINTDWNRWIEYSTPRYNITDVDWEDVNLKSLLSYSAARR